MTTVDDHAERGQRTMTDRNRRSSPRHRTLKSGKIVLANHTVVYDCRVRNLSDDGALLKLPNTLDIPERFELRIVNEDIQVNAVVRWRTATELGVQFERDGE
ncbi:PilZ domain-containing protein [Stappia sp. ES.058]|uniref:PilZ domain-containing protein n=1 Tax=Stappia sp. ES.058 TaxID=1881061 RepID=UPI00087D53F7|nr:PilZ domain-containing protein [Stappia sp. ES.058]SDT90859.1 two-component system, cell cycle response regulator [Stappia sp. ES.058]